MYNNEYKYLAKEFKKITNLDLLSYKENQMVRRVEMFMKQNNINDYEGLVYRIKTDKETLNKFQSHLTINVTEFFRNSKFWKVLFDKLLPEYVKKQKRKIRFWSAACSTGEEPYTIAMLMKEHFPELDFEIIATDVDEEALEKAKCGRYIKNDLLTLKKYYLDKYFVVLNDREIEISPDLKKVVTFKKMDLLSDSYPRLIDVIVCRNVLIYFNEDAKEMIYQSFSKSLKPNGILFIGATERIYEPSVHGLQLLETFFYQKNRL